MATSPDQFQPVTTPAPDFAAPINWSERAIPVQGEAAVIAGTTAALDPGTALSADIALQPGSTGSAALSGNGGAFSLTSTATIEVGGAGAVTAGLFASDSLINQGSISVSGTGSALDVAVDLGAVSGQAGAPAPSFGNQGVISIADGGSMQVAGTEFENTGSILVDGGTLAVLGGALGGTDAADIGYVQLERASIARFSDAVGFQEFSFAEGGGTISLADPWIGSGVTLSGFGAGDRIELPGQQAGQLQAGADALTLSTAGGITEGIIALATPLPLGLHFAMVPEAAGSAIIAEANPPCFAQGTRILTPSGYRPVEELTAGDPVVTAAGGVAAVLWTGRRHVDIGAHPRPHAVRPVRILPGALAEGVPCRPLRLSPDHALYLDGVLIPVKHLVNGATILRESACPAVTYHHIELQRHGIVLAENLACETYLDTGNRAGFEDGPVDFARSRNWDQHAFAPLCAGGPVLRAARARLLDRVRALGFRPRTLTGISLLIEGKPMPRLPGPAARPRFALPGRHGGRAIIRSARFIPAEFEADSADERPLGIALSAVAVGAEEMPLDRLIAGGFYPRAADDAARWTDGAGELRIEAGACSLTLHVAALPRVWEKPAAPA